MTNLHTLYSQYGVSPWIDNLSREMIDNTALQSYVDKGIRGVTSNPSIFEKAFAGGYYTNAIESLRQSGLTSEDIYWQLAVEDIQSACDVLLSVYDESGHNDGFVSLEVSPEYAHDTERTTAQALQLASHINRPNLMIKIPATLECLQSISDVIGAGINVNVTLIFGLHRYLQVINAYMNGLEKCSNPSGVRSVASFFISRVDTLLDPQLPANSELKGTIALAQAQAAYGIFLESFSPHAERWQNLVRRGAVPQRTLWASTSTKDPAYPDLIYVEGLLGTDSVNTMPPSTIDAVLDHFVTTTPQLNPEVIQQAHDTLAHVASQNINMNSVAEELEKDGVQKFKDAFGAMLSAIG